VRHFGPWPQTGRSLRLSRAAEIFSHRGADGAGFAARDISPSLIHESVITGSSARQATRAAAANGHDTDLPAAEQADMQVLAGVIATQS
jgi:hypothetical protein